MSSLFDRDLVRAHGARAARQPVDFLWRKMGTVLQDRLLDIKRDFATAVEIAPHRVVLTPEFLHRKKMERVFHIASLAGSAQAVVDDEFLPLKEGSLDALLSVGVLQWVNDVPGALVQARRALKPDGVFMAAIPGGETLTELRDVLTQTEINLYGGVSPRIAPFASLQDMAALMQRAGFALPVVDQEKWTVTYQDVISLVADLRGMGQGNAVSRRNGKPLSRRFWLEADRLYRERYATEDGRLKATAEILFVIGWAPDASQPQPLRRGSATHRLADILKTDEIGLDDFV